MLSPLWGQEYWIFYLPLCKARTCQVHIIVSASSTMHAIKCCVATYRVPSRFEFHTKTYFLLLLHLIQYLGYIYTKKRVIVYLKLKCN